MSFGGKQRLVEISNICISCFFLNPTHKQFVVTALGWDYGIFGWGLIIAKNRHVY